ncbi:MAG: hypothetical protein WC788_03670 [Candidatus Paceibacterota bacterium]|jgi:hypothetical protein
MELNKKIYFSLIVFAISIAQETNATLSTFDFTSPIEKTDVKIILTDFLKWLLTVVGSFAFLALIIAGISYMTSMGNVEKAKKAKKSVLWIIGGLVLILLSYSILVVLDSIFTG